jgi:hypothetical protein
MLKITEKKTESQEKDRSLFPGFSNQEIYRDRECSIIKSNKPLPIIDNNSTMEDKINYINIKEVYLQLRPVILEIYIFLLIMILAQLIQLT